MSDLLALSLALAVPLCIDELQKKGGPTEQDFKEAQAFGQVLAEHDDDLLFKSKKKGRTAELFNGTAHALAVLAFCPGGVKAFGVHWEAKA